MSNSPRSTGSNGEECIRRAHALGDRAGHGIGLLGGQATLLEGEGGDVADGVNVVEAAYPSEPVDRDEAVRVVR